MRYFSCPACGCHSAEPLFEMKEGGKITRCNRCALLYRRLPDSHELLKYDSDCYAKWDITDDQIRYRETKMPDFHRFLAGIRSFKRAGKLLDVGCGTGEFLKCAQEAGFNCIGVEPHTRACLVARSRNGVEVHNTDFLSFRVADETFDIVTMIHLLEHLRDPAAALRKAHEILSHEGILAIELPCITAFWFTLLGFRHPIFEGSHITFFSRKTVLDSVRRHGFSVLEVRYSGRTMSISHLLERLFNVILRHGDLPQWSGFQRLSRALIHVNLGFALQVYATKR